MLPLARVAEVGTFLVHFGELVSGARFRYNHLGLRLLRIAPSTAFNHTTKAGQALNTFPRSEERMGSLVLTEITIVIILLVVSLVAILVRRVRIPYTVALVLAGFALTLQTQWRLEMTPELVLALFLPPLLFEAAFHIQADDLKADLVPILTMAIPGVLISTFLIGGLLTLAGILPLSVALLFGALISATDPVSVVALFKALGAPRRLTTLLEGESLFNDGTAIVVFQIMTVLVVEGTLDPIQGVLDFFRVALGGAAIGLLLGYLVAQLIARIDDYLIETTLTTVLAYGAYLIAEHFHVSGVLAVVMAGLVNGNIGPRGMSPTTRIVLFNFWEYLAFLANSFVFLLIGMNIEIGELIAHLYPIMVAIGVVLLVRATVVYGLNLLLRVWKKAPPLVYQHVLFWGGLRGAVSLALVFALVEQHIPYDRQLLALTFGVVLFTLVVQGISIRFLIQYLGLSVRHPVVVQYERLQGELLATRAAKRHLERMHREGAIIPQAWETVSKELTEREQQVVQAIERLLEEHPHLAVSAVRLARAEALRAQRAALLSFAREGLLSEEIVHELINEIDGALHELTLHGNGEGNEQEPAPAAAT